MTTRSRLLIVYTDRFSKRNIETSPLFDLLNAEFEVSLIDSAIFESRPKWHKVLSSLLVKILQYRFSEIHQFKKHLLKKKYENVQLFNHYDKTNWCYGFPFPQSKILFELIFLLNKLLPSTLSLDTKYDVVFITGCQEGFAQFVLKKLNDVKVPVVGLINSWDHLTFRGPAYDYPCVKKILVWGEMQERELLNYHQIPQEKIVKVGSPQFDLLEVIKKENSSRSEVNLGDDDFIVFLPAYNERHGFNEPLACELIYDFLVSQNIRFKLVIRPYPKDLTFNERFCELLKREHVMVNTISQDFEIDRRNLTLYLKHCDVVICGPGTVAVEAMYFCKPVVFLAFECREEFKSYEIASERFFTDHYKHIAKPKSGVLIYDSKDLLPAILKIYNKDFCLEQESVLKEQIFKCDGQSGRRIFDEVMNVVK